MIKILLRCILTCLSIIVFGLPLVIGAFIFVIIIVAVEEGQVMRDFIRMKISAKKTK